MLNHFSITVGNFNDHTAAKFCMIGNSPVARLNSLPILNLIVARRRYHLLYYNRAITFELSGLKLHQIDKKMDAIHYSIFILDQPSTVLNMGFISQISWQHLTQSMLELNTIKNRKVWCTLSP